ncbi:MAG: inositol monophosphatase family protein [Bacteroidota bacterium]
MNLERINKAVNDLCIEAGNYISSEQRKLSSDDIAVKGLHDYVTHVDRQSEKMLVDGLSGILPGSGFLVEENTVANTNEAYTWIIDPLDGTTNFIHGLPTFAISIALMHEQKVVMGTVYDVRAEECYYAWKGSSAFMNGKKISVSDRPKLEESLLATGFPYNDFKRQEEYLQMLGHLMQNCRGIRRYGSAAIDLAWVACGRFDGFWEYGLKPWDVAAGSFIAERAGGKCSDFAAGHNFLHGREIVCGNPDIHNELLELTDKFFDK